MVINEKPTHTYPLICLDSSPKYLREQRQRASYRERERLAEEDFLASRKNRDLGNTYPRVRDSNFLF